MDSNFDLALERDPCRIFGNSDALSGDQRASDLSKAVLKMPSTLHLDRMKCKIDQDFSAASDGQKAEIDLFNSFSLGTSKNLSSFSM